VLISSRLLLLLLLPRPPRSTLVPYTTLFRSRRLRQRGRGNRLRAHGAGARLGRLRSVRQEPQGLRAPRNAGGAAYGGRRRTLLRSEEHTSELQSRENLVCRLLLEKKNKRRKR